MKKAKTSILGKIIIGFMILSLIAGLIFWILNSLSPASLATDVQIVSTNPSENIPVFKRNEVEIPTVDFSLSAANTIPPEAILEEITYYGNGGGSLGEPYFRIPECNSPHEYNAPSYGNLTVAYMWSCGWQPGESVDVSVTYPDSSQIMGTVKAESDGLVFYDLSYINMPIGKYALTFKMNGSSGHLEKTVEFDTPAGPRIYKIKNKLVFYNFAPSESIQVFAYYSFDSTPLRFAGWQQYKTDKNGMLSVNISGAKNLEFYVASKQSGWVAQGLYHSIPLDRFFRKVYAEPYSCGGFVSRLTGKLAARIVSTDSLVKIKANAGFSNRFVDIVPSRTVVEITGGPKCLENIIWWNILVRDKSHTITSMGWLNEEQNGNYLLEPLQHYQTVDRAVNGMPIDDYLLSPDNTILPDGILQAISYQLANKKDECQFVDSPRFYVPDEADFLDTIVLKSCGWENDETVELTINHNREPAISRQVLTPHYGSIYYVYEPSLLRQMGIYFFKLKSKSGRYIISAETRMKDSAQPSMYSLPDKKIVLYHFFPGEKVRLFNYRIDPRDNFLQFYTWKEFNIGDTGNLVIKNLRDGYYYAIGDISGFISDRTWQANPIDNKTKSILMLDCGGIKSRLNTGMKAQLALINTQAYLFTEPSFLSKTITSLKSGVKIMLLDRFCAENSTWWQVRSETGTEGWIAEEQNGVYLLEPIK